MRQELNSLAGIPIVVSSESQILATPMGKHGASTIFWEAFSAADAEKN